jgi:hypothetical protein
MKVSYDKDLRQKAKDQDKGLLSISTTNTKKQTMTLQAVLPDITLTRIMNEISEMLKGAEKNK